MARGTAGLAPGRDLHLVPAERHAAHLSLLLVLRHAVNHAVVVSLGRLDGRFDPRRRLGPRRLGNDLDLGRRRVKAHERDRVPVPAKNEVVHHIASGRAN